MRSTWIFAWLACTCACGGSSETVAEPAAPTPPPTVTATAAAPAPPVVASHAVAPVEPLAAGDDAVLAVDFVEARNHPEAVDLDATIRSAPAWRVFPAIDPMRDLDWMIQQGNDLLVHHAVADAQVDAAIAAIAKPESLGVAGVVAWRGVVNGADVVFLRAQPRVIRITPASTARSVAVDLVAKPPRAPAFAPSEAARVLVPHPGRRISGVPDDVTEARVAVESHANDSSADIWVEADCPDATAARTDAARVAELIQEKNNFAVRLVTAGLLNSAEVHAAGRHVNLHLKATSQQIQSVLALVRAQSGGP